MKIHHIGVLVKDIPSEAVRLCACCGYEVVSPIVEDKVQTARVQFLRLPGDSPYLELVSPIGENSKLSGALQKGAPLHHICYQSRDICADLERFRANGFLTLCQPVPAPAFANRKIAWVMDAKKNLVELVEEGGTLQLK